MSKLFFSIKQVFRAIFLWCVSWAAQLVCVPWALFTWDQPQEVTQGHFPQISISLPQEPSAPVSRARPHDADPHTAPLLFLPRRRIRHLRLCGRGWAERKVE